MHLDVDSHGWSSAGVFDVCAVLFGRIVEICPVAPVSMMAAWFKYFLGGTTACSKKVACLHIVVNAAPHHQLLA